MTEADLIPIICTMLLGGTPELRVPYALADSAHHVFVDCVTDTHAIEIGLDDRRSSLDSLQQALFYAALLERQPMVILVDTDGREDATEYQVETAARTTGVEYRVIDVDFLIRLQMTAPFRAARAQQHLTQ
ncbi:hypothetical protein OE810_09925 [Rhodobacteraceae bacterium XHP0102]|nr:hypothetical protein [Rhodobacteraceae bacterium XHP0102]